MRIDKFTVKAQEAIQEGQTIARRAGHPVYEPEHLLKAMLAQDDGITVPILRRIGADPKLVESRLDEALAKFPRVSSGEGQSLSQRLLKLFDKAEDALPVSPTFDGDTDLDNNAAEKEDGPAGHYKDGVIGGDQKLSSGFAVTKKGDYTVLSYSFYYPHNKAGDYHHNDYSTAQVYLKPGPDGNYQRAIPGQTEVL